MVRARAIGWAFGLAASAGGAALSAAPTPNVRVEPRRPNIVLIVADDLGYGHLGAYGQRLIRTPHLNALAAGGVRFTSHYAGSSVCAPSRSCLMTGLHTGHTPVRNNGLDRHLYPSDLTLAEVLKRAGYATGGFGKWGIGDIHTPGVATRQGFDTWFGHYNQTHAHFFYPFWVWSNESRYLLPQNERGRQRYVHDVIHRQALRFIRTVRPEPYFAYLPYTLPHVELVVPEDSERPYRGSFPKVAIPDSRPGYLGSEDGYVTFAGMVSRLDAHVGEVLQAVRETGQEKNTLVLFTSDNGPQGGGVWGQLVDFFDGNGPFRGSKGEFYEGGLRVPLIASMPGKIPTGRTVESASANWDLFPTLAEIAGLDAPAGLDGRSLWGAMRGDAAERKPRTLYWEMPTARGLALAVRQGRWKLVRPRGNAPAELYDLATDPGESGNLAASHPDQLRQLQAAAEREHLPEREYPPAPPRNVGQFVR